MPGYVQCGLDDEQFLAGMWDLVLQNAPSSTFGLLMAILAPYVGRLINEVTTVAASLGELKPGGSREGCVQRLSEGLQREKGRAVYLRE